jgi:hypothetical protein
MSVFERSVTVNFTNKSSSTLYYTGGHQENDSDYSYTLPPGAIEAGQTVTWKNAESVLVSTNGYADYKFTREDNGQDGHVHIAWNDPIKGDNSYDVTCDSTPLYGVFSSGDTDGTSPTLDVTFIGPRNLTLKYLRIENQGTGFLAVSPDGSKVAVLPAWFGGKGDPGPGDLTGWAFIDNESGQEVPWSDLTSAYIQGYLTAFALENNRIGLYTFPLGAFPDEVWELRVRGGGQAIIRNVNCGKNLAISSEGLAVGSSSTDPPPEEIWSLTSGS